MMSQSQSGIPDPGSGMTDADHRPQPMLPADIDLTRLPKMMIDLGEVVMSPMMLEVADRALRAAFHLLFRSWWQKPAGSLPADDAQLAYLAGLGAGPAATKRWLKIRNEALQGWVLCSDGRYYNTMLTNWVADAWQRMGGPVPPQPGKQHRHTPAQTPGARRMRLHRARKKVEESATSDRAGDGCDARDGGVTPVTESSVTCDVTSPLKGKEKRKNTSSPQSPPAGGGEEIDDPGGGRAGGDDGSPDAGTRSHRRVMMPVDWTPDAEGWQLARERGMSDKAIRAEAEQFRDYWRSRGDRRTDWSGQWRCRVRDLTKGFDADGPAQTNTAPIQPEAPPGPGADDPTWQAITAAFRRLDRRGEGDFRSWLRPLGFHGIDDDGTLTLTSNSRFAADKVRQLLGDRLRDAALAAGIPVTEVDVSVGHAPPAPIDAAQLAAAASIHSSPSARAAA